MEGGEWVAAQEGKHWGKRLNLSSLHDCPRCHCVMRPFSLGSLALSSFNRSKRIGFICSMFNYCLYITFVQSHFISLFYLIYVIDSSFNFQFSAPLFCVGLQKKLQTSNFINKTSILILESSSIDTPGQKGAVCWLFNRSIACSTLWG